MANANGWGDGSVNNNIGWGQGAVNNNISWGKSQITSWSGATDIDGGNAPVNTVAPAITGTAQEGQTLTCSTGTWSGSPTYTYQWKRNGSNIGSATNSTYLLVTADVGQSILCTVTATNALGSSNANSNTVTPTSSVDSDAQAFITAAAITDPTQQAAINTLVVDLKGYNVWSKMKALYLFVGSTASQHKWNLKDSRDLDAAYRLVFNGGWTHSSTGATPNGTNAYADTKLVPSTALSFANTHLSIYSRTDSVKDAWNGSSGTSFLPIIGLLLKSSDSTPVLFFDSYDYLGVGNRMSITNTDSRGHFIGNVYSNTSQKVYKNGSLFGTNTNTQTQTTLPAYSIFLSGRNDVGTTSSFDNKQLGFASIGDGLTDTEAANFYTAVQAFQTTLGRQV